MAQRITSAEIEGLCDLATAIESQRKVFANYYLGNALLGPRAVLSQGENAQFAYLARASETGPTIVKFGTVFPNNPKRNLPAVQTSILALSPTNGSVSYEFDGETVTKLRTVAASMVAIEKLANPPSCVAIVGLGHQGLAHAKALRSVYKPNSIIGITRDNHTSVSSDVFDNISSNLNDLADCNLIILATSSINPILTEKLASGTTCISIGSFSPGRSEVSERTLKSADLIVVDDPKTSLEQCGSVLNFVNSSCNELGADFTPRGLGEVLVEGSGRESQSDVICYFSVGLGIQDAAIVEIVLEKLGS